MKTSARAALFSLVVACLTACGSKPAQFAGSPSEMCITQDKWPALIIEMKKFATENHLTYFGGIDAIPLNGKDRPHLNAAVAEGYNYYFGDELDLWLDSDPFHDSMVYFSPLVKRPATPRQFRLASELLLRLRRFGPPEPRGGEKAICSPSNLVR